jgi:hypothetical protein
MENLTKLNYLSSLSFIIISVFLYSTSNGYQSVSAQEVEEEQEGPSEINREKEEEEEEVESSNDIFSDLSRNLPSIDEDIPNDNVQPLDSEKPLFGNPDTEEFDEKNEISSNSENILESNEQGTTSESIDNSFSYGLSDSAQEPDIINEDDSSSNTKTSSSSSSSRNEVSNDEANNNNIVNPSD